MAKLSAEFIEKFVEILSQEHDLNSYSGRGMYGKRCLSITIDDDDNRMGVVASICMSYVAEYGDADEDELVFVFNTSKSDSMGKGIVLYFPSIGEEFFKVANLDE